MASFLDPLAPFAGLGFNSVRPGGPSGPPMPAPNPLRLPAPAPATQGVGDFLSSLLALPDLSWLVTDRDSPSTEKLRAKDNEKQAREQYNRNGKNAQGDEEQPSDSSEDTSETGGGNTPPLPERNPFSGNGGGAGNINAGNRGPDGSLRVPVPPRSPVIDPFQAMMLQLGASLMVPQWGDGLSQLGQAWGQGMAAAGRANAMNTAEDRRVENEQQQNEDRANKKQVQDAQVRHLDAQTNDLNSGESSRARRARGKTPSVIDEAAAAANLGPKGKAYFAQRLKSLNQEDLLGEDTDTVATYNKIIEEAQKLDAPAAPANAPNVGGTETKTSLPVVKSPEEAMKLAPGTQFLFEDPKTKKVVLGTVPNR